MFNFQGKTCSRIRRTGPLHLKAIWNLLSQLSSDFKTELKAVEIDRADVLKKQNSVYRSRAFFVF